MIHHCCHAGGRDLSASAQNFFINTTKMQRWQTLIAHVALI
jgi:hypothetical protein